MAGGGCVLSVINGGPFGVLVTAWSLAERERMGQLARLVLVAKTYRNNAGIVQTCLWMDMPASLLATRACIL